MMEFDYILFSIREILTDYQEEVKTVGPMIINRDLNGRVRLVLEEKPERQTEVEKAATAIAEAMYERLGPHGFSAEQTVLFESSLDRVKQGALHFPLGSVGDVTVVDRLATETHWTPIAPISPGPPCIVFFSIKGGVGRSTASAVAAWSLAQSGKRVMVLDLDLESPGISSSLLPDEKRPTHGITDWLVEDLVGNGPAVFESMVALSDLSHDGEIRVVPAHGKVPGEYISKLGRVWMPKMDEKGLREPWSGRLNRLLGELEARWKPDVVLIDSRAGIDEVASACITDLGAKTVLLFAIDGDQTWSGYNILFDHWNLTGVAREIRERLQLVGAMIPELNEREYFEGLRERSWTSFAKHLYDEVPGGEQVDTDYFNFDLADETAPHFPWSIRWHRGFAALQSIHSRLQGIDKDEVKAIFGPFLNGVHEIAGLDGEVHE